MAIVGMEWVVVGVIVVVMLVWGPNQIPKLARMLGMARREFELAQKEFMNPAPEQPGTVSTQPEPATMTDDELITMAQRLGIVTKGMTREQLSAEVAKNASRTGVQPLPQPFASRASTEAATVTAKPETPGAAPAASKQPVEGERLLAAARQLGISVDGKTNEQVREEIRKALA